MSLWGTNALSKYQQPPIVVRCVWAMQAVLGSAKTVLKFKYQIQIGYHICNSMYGAENKLEKWKK